ncbi:MAG: 1,4-dihydroxy-6-naphthoate synthase [Nitrospirae bacterium]|nr:1,4-dihydroxy-6-naphthoate synthase [Nitrospirota bacterium]
MKTLSLGYSPCPNDTFIFYALVHGMIPSEDLRFREILEDVETLNRMALRAELDITKVSYHAFGLLRDRYCLLRSGGALGMGCGPLIVTRKTCDLQDLRGKSIAVPGNLTTAFLLLQILDPCFKERAVVMPFHLIIDAVRKGEVDAGLIIHESRFTYEKAGLKKVIDLGDWWEKETGLPIPLGGILARRSLGEDLIREVDVLVRKSVEYAFSHRKEPLSYIRRHSREMDEAVIHRHIDLYVNDFSLDIGDNGIRAVEELFKRAEEKGIIGKSSEPVFMS